MSPSTNQQFTTEVVPEFACGWCLFLDIDGTLLELAERPDMVEVPVDTLRLLSNLSDACNGALALISGRTLGDIDTLFAPLLLHASGLHGNQRRDARGIVSKSSMNRTEIGLARERLLDFAERNPGVLMEDKGAALALHYRLAPQLRGKVWQCARSAEALLGEKYALQAGKMVVEIKPSGADKGTVVEEFLTEPPFTGKTPVFIGDDITDEDGFRAVNNVNGYAIKVGGGETLARFSLRDPAAVHEWLSAYLDYLSANTEHACPV